ncbi:hypothetical protein CR513_26225, partial [Mucuna pruriens]
MTSKGNYLHIIDPRIVSTTKETLCEASLKRKFTGHLVIDRAAIQKLRQEMRNAVSTSHCSQPNTIEYEWPLNGYCIIRSPMHAGMDYVRQMKEIQDGKSKLKMDRILSNDTLPSANSLECWFGESVRAVILNTNERLLKMGGVGIHQVTWLEI